MFLFLCHIRGGLLRNLISSFFEAIILPKNKLFVCRGDGFHLPKSTAMGNFANKVFHTMGKLIYLSLIHNITIHKVIDKVNTNNIYICVS